MSFHIEADRGLKEINSVLKELGIEEIDRYGFFGMLDQLKENVSKALDKAYDEGFMAGKATLPTNGLSSL